MQTFRKDEFYTVSMQASSFKILFKILIIFVFSGCLSSGSSGSDASGTEESKSSSSSSREALGRKLFFDTTLSNPTGMSCATCHNPAFAFTDPGKPVSEGSRKGVFGRRNSPTLMYEAFSPNAHFSSADGTFIGGQFWDGRASDLNEQAAQPLLHPREMNNIDKASVVKKVASGSNAEEMKSIYGSDIFSDSEKAFDSVLDALSSFEMTEEFSPFTSKYDYFLKGKAQLSPQEQHGLELFNRPDKANCAACHPSTPVNSQPPLFTDFTYDNLGAPKNTASPFYSQPSWNNPDANNFVDLGLYLHTGKQSDKGKFKVPTLRNIERTAPYFHNGVFTDLETVVRFYNSRDLGGFGPPEVTENVNRVELGNLRLNDQEIVDLVAFLRTLNDGYRP